MKLSAGLWSIILAVCSMLCTIAALVCLSLLVFNGDSDDAAARSEDPASVDGPVVVTVTQGAEARDTAEPTESALNSEGITAALSSVCGGVSDQATVSHPHLGSAHVGVYLPVDRSENGCIGVIDDHGNTLLTRTISVYHLDLAAPVQDATGNLFITYNPGRYNGVITLIPTEDGYDGPSAGEEELDYRTDQHIYYYAELTGPDSDGRYQIEASNNDCDPSCAGGTITSETLSWNGHDYS